MLGTEKFLHYFENIAGSNPLPFLRKDRSGSLDIAKANIMKLQMRMIYCLTGSRGKEFLVIPIGYNLYRFFVVLLSGNSLPKTSCFNQKFMRFGFSWLQSDITQVSVEDLTLYVNHRFKTTFLTSILQGARSIELPITNKIIKFYTPAGYHPNILR
jgi:hypothetical protein